MTSIFGHTAEKVCDKCSIDLKFRVGEDCMSCALEKIILAKVSVQKNVIPHLQYLRNHGVLTLLTPPPPIPTPTPYLWALSPTWANLPSLTVAQSISPPSPQKDAGL